MEYRIIVSIALVWGLLYSPSILHAPPVSRPIPKNPSITVEVTAYSVGDGMTPSDTMANGEKVHVGAVAYNDVPLGTKIMIDGKVYTVKDRMEDDGVVDIYMDSITEAIKHGRKVKNILILE